ncbi:MAG TPA: heme-binding protein [Verrucomicrobiae bacterium]|nr:heme-binding protein [Verrucomicrobiae bacterium]
MSERNVKEPAYRVERVADGYEVRSYDPLVVAEASVPPESGDPLSDGFRMLFAYITGANSGTRQIPMTAPVLQEKRPGENIPMTAPVIREKRVGGSPVVAFVLPADLTVDTAPLPTDPRIRLRPVPSRRVAVVRFSGYASDRIMEEKREKLRGMLERDALKPEGDFIEAYYNPPWTPPFMRRNEVMVEVAR